MNPHAHRRRLAREDGFTMIVAVLALFISSLVVTAAFVAAQGDVKLTGHDTEHKKAYYAAMAGISAYKYKLSAEPNYWKKCPSITETNVPGAEEEHYKVQTLPAAKTTSKTECENNTSKILVASGSASGTFRIISTGIVGSGSSATKVSLIATFTHPGFLDYVYLTNYEILDPTAANLEATSQHPNPSAECEHYYAYRVEHSLTSLCGTIIFAANDKINGPMHTNDAAAICAEGSSEPTFGRTSKDKVEMNGGHYAGGGSCKNSPDIVGTYTEKGPTLTPPETDTELIEEADYKFKGRTIIELKEGTPNKIEVYNKNLPGGKEIKSFPENGVIYVENEGGCAVKYTPFGTNYEGDESCGNVYVKGKYTESLTIAAQNDLVIAGSVTTTSESSGKPTGSAVLGLIATNFVRVYHPVAKSYGGITPFTPTLSSSGTSTVKNEESKPIESPTLESSGLSSPFTEENLPFASPTITESTTVAPTTESSATASPTLTASARQAPTLSAATKKTSGKCEPTSEYESYGGSCYSKNCSGGTYYGEGKCAKCNTGYEYLTSEKTCGATSCTGSLTYYGEGKCAKCNTGYEYLTSNKKCASTSCSSGWTYFGEGKCAKCNTGYEYLTSNKKCASTTCVGGTYMAGEGTCAKCNTGYEYLTSNKKCASTTCANGAYLGEGKCSKCNTGYEYLSSEKKCASTTCVNGTYAGEGKCARCNTGFEYLSSTKKCVSTSCTNGTYLGGGKCASCETGYEYLSTPKECVKTSCATGYEYFGEGKCGKCAENEFSASEKKCGKCKSTVDQYIGSESCEYENSSGGCDAPNLSASEDTLHHWGSIEPTIDAAILSTAHSFIVDNYECGSHLGELTVWGSIAQFWRGTVGRGSAGFTKNYNYDERLETLEPPDFLTPSSSIYKLARVTAAANGEEAK